MATNNREAFPALEKQLDTIPDDVLGQMIKEYVGESNHQGIPWEGFDTRDMTGIRRFFEDLWLYVENHTNSPVPNENH